MLDSDTRYHFIYLLPNIFTTAALFAGFYSIIQSINCQFEISSIAIFIAILFDAMDGRIARLTKTESNFGKQYDSLSDMVSFGVAPAILIYNYILINLGTFGYLATFIYLTTVALRLAKFNNSNIIKEFFQGLPSPAAAGLITSFVWICVDNKLSNIFFVNCMAINLTIFTSFNMLANIEFYNGKNISYNHMLSFYKILIFLLMLAFIKINPPIILFSIFVFYSISGWICFCLKINYNEK
ncbi:hypothetical protein CKSOR_00494 [Candidatus Kinetoplastibacterium sorsogonicusi]|uniref:CDP-diacylglycerol--serine O-phosphatidyltransferase n=1 Tax=Candidatus Kinetoplastidibacterium kentomonadis TaxID=1576550 RepID=A0A3S7JAA7_9PROT|nr:CDP-diacylglycerol--serine O-phosphatidyltransferase [Candidatus Kinetoplastibacterium sorsogonicusi]AWD32603.1 hypothetical protein CKSOR_00494 [Candidatus Kinetoplastibacterium sorsogonicusi]